jgi:hypothetical protein
VHENAPGHSSSRKTVARITAPGVSVPFSSDPGHTEHIVSTLACLVPDNHTPIEHVIEEEESMFPTGATVVLVSAVSTVSELAIAQLLDRRLHGAAVYLALTGDPAKLRVDTYNLPVFYLGGREKWHELIATVHEGEHDSGTSATLLQLD